MPHTKTHFLQEELPEVPVEVAAFVRRRNLGTVEVPCALTGAVEAAAAASSSRSSKLQRKETVQLTAALKQLSRTPGKGGSAMSLIDANAGSSEKRRRKRVTLVAVLGPLVLSKHPSSSHYDFACLQTPPVKQTLRDLRHALPVSMTSPEEDDSDDSDAESSWDTSDATEDQFRNAFGNHDLPGVLSVPYVVICCLLGAAISPYPIPALAYCSVTGKASPQLLTCYVFIMLRCAPHAMSHPCVDL